MWSLVQRTRDVLWFNPVWSSMSQSSRKKWSKLTARSRKMWTWDLSESVIHDFNYGVTDRNPNDRLMRCFSPGDRPQLLITAALDQMRPVPTSQHHVRPVSLMFVPARSIAATAPPPRHMARTDRYIIAARSQHGQLLSDFHEEKYKHKVQEKWRQLLEMK